MYLLTSGSFSASIEDLFTSAILAVAAGRPLLNLAKNVHLVMSRPILRFLLESRTLAVIIERAIQVSLQERSKAFLSKWVFM